MTTLKLGWRLAFSGDVRQRWRQISVILGAFAATAMVLFAVGMLHVAQASGSRIAARSPIWANGPGDDRLHLSARGLKLEGFGQFPVVWLEPVAGHEDDPAVVPPGLSRLPDPGEAVLSKGLMEQGWTAQDFGLRPSAAGKGPKGAIGSSGLSTESEGWIYARPDQGRSLGVGGALLRSRGYPGSTEDGINFETILEVPSSPDATLGVIWLLLLPSGYLLFGAATAMSSVRDARAQTLWRLGVASGRIRLLLALETAFLAMSGALPALCLWVFVLSGVRTVPLTAAALQPGALSYPLWVAAGAVLVTVLTAAATASVERIRDRSIARDTRRVRSWHAIPLVMVFAMMAIGPWLSPTSGLRFPLLLGGLLLTFAALPMALPSVVAQLGTQFGRSSRPAIWLAGRRLALKPANLARPAAMVGALVFLAGAAFAIYDRLVAAEESTGSNTSFAAFDLNWRDARAGDLAEVKSLAGALAVLPVETPQDGSQRVLFSSCSQVQRWVQTPNIRQCTAENTLTREFSSYFHEVTRHTPAIGAGHGAIPGAAFIIGPRSTTSQDVMKATGRLPAVNIAPLGGGFKIHDPQAGWMLAGWTLATLLLATALIREIGDRGLSSMQDASHLLRLGLTRKQINESYLWSLLPPVAVAIPIGFVSAVVFALLGYELGVTSNNLASIAVVAGLASGIAGVIFAVVFAIQHRIADMRE